MINLKYLLAPFIIKPILRLNNFTYIAASRLAVHLNREKIHPKHDILKYEKWFLDNIEPGWTVLDVGCNTGTLAMLLSEKAKRVVGVDIDRELIEVANRNNNRDNVTFIHGDATKMAVDVGIFDSVILSNVLEHIEERPRFLGQLVDSLSWNTKNKIFLIRVPLLERDWLAVYKKNIGVPYLLDDTHFVEYTEEQFFDEMHQSGIEVENHYIRFGELFAICRVVNK